MTCTAQARRVWLPGGSPRVGGARADLRQGFAARIQGGRAGLGREVSLLLTLALLMVGLGCRPSVSPTRGPRGSSGSAAINVVEVVPASGRQEVGPRSRITITYSSPLDPSSVVGTSIQVLELGPGRIVAGNTALRAQDRELLFEPLEPLRGGARYLVDVAADLRGAQGEQVAKVNATGQALLPVFYDAYQAPPLLAGGVAAAGESSTAVSVTWSPAVDIGSAPESIVYELFAARASDPLDVDGRPTQTTPPGTTHDIVSRLEPGATYQISIRAVDEVGNRSAPSPPVFATTLRALDETPPQFQGLSSLEAPSPSMLLAGWEPATDGDGDPPEAIRYSVFVFLQPDPTPEDLALPALVTPAGADGAVIDGVAPNTEHFVLVRALDSAGNEETNRVVLSATTPLGYVQNIEPILLASDPLGCWPACAAPAPGGCARGDAFCHSGSRRAGNFNLASFETLLAPRAGGRQPPYVLPFNGAGSYMLQRMDPSNPRYRTPLMPRGAQCPLDEACLQEIVRWIDQGAFKE